MCSYLLSGSPKDGEELERLASALRAASEGVGFYYITGYESLLPRDVCRRALNAARQAHALDAEAKRAWLLDDADSGFMPAGATTRWGSLGQPPLPISDGNVEAVLFWGAGPPWSKRMISSFDENQMPPAIAAKSGLDCAEWIDHTKEYFVCVRRLAEALLPAYAVALKMPANHFDGQFDNPCWCMRMNCYEPDRDVTRGPAVGIPPHADGDFATYLLTDDQPGLSVLRADGEWIHISALPDGVEEFSMLVNSGNTLQRLSNGSWPSTMHTASCFTDKTRFSIPFFWSPDVDVVIEPLAPWITEERGAQYASRASGKVESSGEVGQHAKKDPLRTDTRANSFKLDLAAKEFAAAAQTAAAGAGD